MVRLLSGATMARYYDSAVSTEPAIGPLPSSHLASHLNSLIVSILSFEQGTLKTSDFLFRVVTESMYALAAVGSLFPVSYKSDGSKIHKTHDRLSLNFQPLREFNPVI
jgi:hypothetical protein